jgi:hypothetical protein
MFKQSSQCLACFCLCLLLYTSGFSHQQPNGSVSDNGSGQRGTELIFVEGDKQADPRLRNLQRPRVFYRRELEANPLIVSGQ